MDNTLSPGRSKLLVLRSNSCPTSLCDFLQWELRALKRLTSISSASLQQEEMDLGDKKPKEITGSRGQRPCLINSNTG